MRPPRQSLPPLARAGRNLLQKSVGEAAARACFAALFIFAARWLGAEEYGRYSYAASLAALALIGMDLGLNTLVVRDCARNPEALPRYSGALMVIKLGLAGLVLGLILVFSLAKGFSSQDTALIMVVALSQALWGLAEFGVAGLNALERMDLDAMVKSSSRLAALVLAGGLMLAGFSLWGLVAGLFAANLLGAVVSLKLLKSQGRFLPALDFAFLGYLFRESLPLALTSVFILVYFRVDIVMMELMGLSFSEIGWYSAGVRIIDAVGMVPAMAAGALLPVLSSLVHTRPDAAAKLYRQGQRLLMILGLPAAVGLWMVRDKVTTLIYGPQYAQTAPVFLWLAPMLAILFLNHLQLAMLTAQGRQKLCAVATGVCVVVNVGLNLWLIPEHGFLGAAAATLATETALFIQCVFFIKGSQMPGRLLTTALRPALAAAFMGVCLWLGGDFPLPVTVLAGALIYALSLVASGGLGKDEVAELWRIMRSPAQAVEAAERN